MDNELQYVPLEANDAMPKLERRNISTRATVVRNIIDSVIQNPSVTLSVETLQAWLSVPTDAAQRILAKLASSGLLRELNNGIWVRGTVPGAPPNWY